MMPPKPRHSQLNKGRGKGNRKGKGWRMGHDIKSLDKGTLRYRDGHSARSKSTKANHATKLPMACTKCAAKLAEADRE